MIDGLRHNEDESIFMDDGDLIRVQEERDVGGGVDAYTGASSFLLSSFVVTYVYVSTYSGLYT